MGYALSSIIGTDYLLLNIPISYIIKGSSYWYLSDSMKDSGVLFWFYGEGDLIGVRERASAFLSLFGEYYGANVPPSLLSHTFN